MKTYGLTLEAGGIGKPTTLDGMTWEKWQALRPSERLDLADKSQLNPQLDAFVGDRVEVVRTNGERARFWVGRSTGWRPCYLEVHNSRSMGGDPADQSYQSVTLIRRGPRR